MQTVYDTGASGEIQNGVQVNNADTVVWRDIFFGNNTQIRTGTPGGTPVMLVTMPYNANVNPIPFQTTSGRITSGPAINNAGQIAFTAVRNNHDPITGNITATRTTLETIGHEATYSASNMPINPRTADNGQVLVRNGSKTTAPISSIILWSYDFANGEFGGGGSSRGFTALGASPGMSDDAQVDVFFGDLGSTTSTDLAGPNKTTGPGIFAAVKTTAGRKIVRIAGARNNNQLDPGETFSDFNNNGKFDPGELDSGILDGFSPDARVAVNGTYADDRGVTIVYTAYDGAQKGIYSSRLSFYGDGTSPYAATNPSAFSVSPPTPIATVGETLPGAGQITDLAIDDSVNNRDRGDIVFYATINGSNRAVVRARPSELLLLDFTPTANFAKNLSPETRTNFIFSGGPASFSIDFDAQIDLLDGTRTDLGGSALRTSIISKVQSQFDGVGGRVKVLDANTVDGQRAALWRSTRIFIGGVASTTGLNGLATSVDAFNQDISARFVTGTTLTSTGFFGRDGAVVLLNNIFAQANGNFRNSVGQAVALSQAAGDGAISFAAAGNAVANIISHEAGHAMGLAHIANVTTNATLLMNEFTDPNELRTLQAFTRDANTGQNDQGRLARTVGTNANPPQVPRVPAPFNYDFTRFRALSLSAPAIAVAKAVVGIIHDDDALPEFINLGAGNLATLLATNLPADIGAKFFVLASSNGTATDIFTTAPGVTPASISLDSSLAFGPPTVAADPTSQTLSLYQRSPAGTNTLLGSISSTDNSPPEAKFGDFPFETSDRSVDIYFSENVGGSIAASDLALTNTSTGQTFVATSAAFDANLKRGRWSYAAALPDGNYTALLLKSLVQDSAANALAFDFSQSFHVLAADANRDHKVDFNDLVILAQNYGLSGKTFSQGNFNYSPDGKVDFDDLVILAQKYNGSLAAFDALMLPSPAHDRATKPRRPSGGDRVVI